MVPQSEGVRPTPSTHRALVPVLLGLITLIGALVRATGLGGAGLFYDDAWFALPARVGVGTVLKMVVTTPGYTLLQSAWISAGPAGNAWPKVLPFVLGVLAAPAGYWLSRRCGLPRWVGLAIAGLLAASPAAIEYSVRVKEYEADLLLAVGVLAVAELVRRRGTAASIGAMVAVSIGAVLLSTSLLVVVVGAWSALLMIAIAGRRRAVGLLVGAAITGAACGLTALWVSSHIPDKLTAFWIQTHRLVGAPLTSSNLAHTLALTPAGLLHGLVGMPLPTGRFPLTAQISDSAEVGLLVLAVALLVLLALLVAPSLRAVVRRRVDDPALALLAPSMTMLVALLLWAVGTVPLGTGRTDLVLYPALALLLGGGLVNVAERTRASVASPTVRRRTGVVLAGAAVLLGAWMAWDQRSWYPGQDLATLRHTMATSGDLRPGDVAVVVGRNSYTWAFDGLSPFVVHVDRNDPRARTVGFWVSFTDPRVLAVEPTQATAAAPSTNVIPGLAGLPASAHRLWVYATTNATYSPSAYRLTGPLARAMTPTGVDPLLHRQGWTQQRRRVHAPGVVAVLYTR